VKNFSLLVLFSFFLVSCDQSEKSNFAIAIHGGAGTILRENLTAEMEAEYRNVLETAVRTGHEILKNGGSSQEAVEQTIRVMEDSPLFNAGKGAVLNSLGEVELDASFMDGETLNAGAVSGMQTIKNPISAAIEVMDKSPHVMLSGKGADQFSSERGLEVVSPEYFLTQRRINALEKVKAKERNQALQIEDKSFLLQQKYGTVGCVALDLEGNLAAGTSTGGMTNKKWNRIGDAPIIGAGTYANNKTCAISATGWGEYFIRSVVAYDISALMEYKNLSLQEAELTVIHEKMGQFGGTGGVIVIV
jgi:beta-aspartyl-peptidase (threonine type)